MMEAPRATDTDPALEAGEVHVWHLTCDDDATGRAVDRWESALPAEERRRARRLVVPGDRARFVVSHAMLRALLSRYTGDAAGRLAFARNAHGRPELTSAHAGDLRFNLSRAPGLIALAVARGTAVGVDVECLPPRLSTDPVELAERFFSPLETTALRSLPADERPRQFLRVWTLKEAYVKACGLGLSMPLDRFAFDVAGRSTPTFDVDPSVDDAAAWRFLALSPTPAHLLAVAVRTGGPAPRWRVRACGVAEVDQRLGSGIDDRSRRSRRYREEQLR